MRQAFTQHSGLSTQDFVTGHCEQSGDTARSSPLRSRHRRAFTLIELLVVIGIIAVLMTVVTLGVRSIAKSSREKATRTTIENLKNLVVERHNTGGMQAIYALYNASTTSTPP